MTQAFRSILRETILGDVTVTAFIQDRFYPSEIALISNPAYPCANFSMDSGAGANRDAPRLHSINFSIWTWTEVSIDHAFSIYEAIFNAFERQLLKSSDVYALLFQISSPFHLYDSVARTYGLIGRWNAHVTQRT